MFRGVDFHAMGTRMKPHAKYDGSQHVVYVENAVWTRWKIRGITPLLCSWHCVFRATFHVMTLNMTSASHILKIPSNYHWKHEPNTPETTPPPTPQTPTHSIHDSANSLYPSSETTALLNLVCTPLWTMYMAAGCLDHCVCTCGVVTNHTWSPHSLWRWQSCMYSPLRAACGQIYNPQDVHK